MSEPMLTALIGLAGAVCTSVITAVLGPMAVAYLQRPKPVAAQASNVPIVENPNLVILAVVSLVLGVFNLCNFLTPPICGLPMSILGIIFGYSSMNSSKRGLAIAGMILCIIGLLIGCGNAAYGAYLGSTGQLFFQQ
ncbi:MAG: hypothetical protein HY863_16895 [Chloroflexi bacterium]|nr:hypothetical protein [Chloroflexota bacterium]